MRCIVTGGAGFIGSRLVNKLEQLGHEVFSIDSVVDDKNAGEYKYIWADICNPNYYQKVKHFKTKARADKALKVMDVAKHRLINYEKKHKSIVKAYMHKKANPQIKTHSEGGEVVIGKNVDRSLL